MQQILDRVDIPIFRKEAHVFVVPLKESKSIQNQLESTLTPDELARADRFLMPYLRERYVVCRGRLREILGHAVNRKPGDIRFTYQQWGKPVLQDAVLPTIHFNVSHSGDWALVCIATSPVGVDLEIAQPKFQYKSIESQVVSHAEQRHWSSIPAAERNSEMMRLWVCKEALLKAMGLGIAEGLQQVNFQLPIPEFDTPFFAHSIDSALQLHIEDDGTCSMNHWTDSTTWKMQLLKLLPNSYAAVTVQDRAVEKIQVHLHPSSE